MASKIESTVGHVAADLAKAGFPGSRRVQMVVLDEEDEAKLAEIRAAVAAADASEDVEAEEAFTEIFHELSKSTPRQS